MKHARAPFFAWAVASLAILAYGYLLVLSSWLSDDAFITFRTVDNLVNGFGLTWNTGERVQAYTNTLWMFLVSLFYKPFGDIIYVAYGLSFACALAALALLLKALDAPWSKACAALALISSKAFIDYTSSGLETPLLYALLVLFFALYLGPFRERAPRDTLILWGVGGLCYLARQDTVLLCLPALLHVFYRTWRANRRAAFGQAALGLTPVFCWTAFSLVYYGFIFPNTYYAKLDLGIARSKLLAQGLSYMKVSLVYDPVTLVVIVAAIAFGLLAWRRDKDGPGLQFGLTSLGLAAYLGYVAVIGADFMAGRFYSYVFIVAVLLLCQLLQRSGQPWRFKTLAAGLALYAALWPYAPFRTDAVYEEKWRWDETNGVADERGVYYLASSLLRMEQNQGIIYYYWSVKGIEFGVSDEDVTRMDGIGYFGFYAGPHKHIIDIYGLSDALIARLPPTLDQRVAFRPGHIMRKIPAGYDQTCASGRNELLHPGVRDYYELVRAVTRGELFSLARAKAIWTLTFDRKKYHFEPRALDLAAAQLDQPKPDGYPTDGPGALRFNDDGLILHMGGVRQASGVRVSLGVNDMNAYLLCYRNKGEHLACHVIPREKNQGLRNLQLFTPPTVRRLGFDAIHLNTQNGDNDYAIGSLSVW